jgi:hypothetical protein
VAAAHGIAGNARTAGTAGKECRNSKAGVGTSARNAGTAGKECRNSNVGVGTSARNAGTAGKECRNSNAGVGTSARNAGTAGKECRNSNAGVGPLVADGCWINCYFYGLYYNETGPRISRDRERSLNWVQRPVRKRPGASYMHFSVTAVAKRSPTAFLRRVQEIVMLTLIEEHPFQGGICDS